MSVDFSQMCRQYSFTSRKLQELATKAEVDLSIVRDMFNGISVKRNDAERVLAVLHTLINGAWNLDNTYVPLIPYHYQHFLQFASYEKAKEEAEKLIILSYLGHRVQEQTLIFYTREPLRANERAGLFRALYPLNYTLDICINEEWNDDKSK